MLITQKRTGSQNHGWNTASNRDMITSSSYKTVNILTNSYPNQKQKNTAFNLFDSDSI